AVALADIAGERVLYARHGRRQARARRIGDDGAGIAAREVRRGERPAELERESDEWLVERPVPAFAIEVACVGEPLGIGAARASASEATASAVWAAKIASLPCLLSSRSTSGSCRSSSG